MAKRTMTIDDSAINSLIGRPDVVKEFPFLVTTKKVSTPCGGCDPVAKIDYNALKGTMAGMPSERLDKLKQLLRVDSLRFIWRNGDKAADRTV